MTVSASAKRKVRNQAADAIARLLAADAGKAAGASVKQLTLREGNISKSETHKLTCETLRYKPVIDKVLKLADIKLPKQVRVELVYVLIYELLFGKGRDSDAKAAPPSGGKRGGKQSPEAVVDAHKHALRAALARLLSRANVTSADKLLAPEPQGTLAERPRYLRVNTLKLSVAAALERLKGEASTASLDAQVDPHIPTVLVLPAGTDMHSHPMVLSGELIQQDKASCIPAHVLAPEPGWLVLDACAAPGNKTSQLAALLRQQGSRREGKSHKGGVVACELNAERLKRLRETLALTGARDVQVRHQDFLALDPSEPQMSQVRAILLDPSCSGSGTHAKRMDHLMPSGAQRTTSTQPTHHAPPTETARVEGLARFQVATLRHALSFPSVERVVYSTCSVYEEENEAVVAAVLPAAKAAGLRLQPALPDWPRRGLRGRKGTVEANYLRVDPDKDRMDGFFVALFVRESAQVDHSQTEGSPKGTRKKRRSSDQTRS